MSTDSRYNENRDSFLDDGDDGSFFSRTNTRLLQRQHLWQKDIGKNYHVWRGNNTLNSMSYF